MKRIEQPTNVSTPIYTLAPTQWPNPNSYNPCTLNAFIWHKNMTLNLVLLEMEAEHHKKYFYFYYKEPKIPFIIHLITKFDRHSLNYYIQIVWSFCASFMMNDQKIKPSVITIHWKFRKPSETHNFYKETTIGKY